MNPETYLQSGEEMLEHFSASRVGSGSLFSSGGDLVVSPLRLVFIEGNDVIDVPLDQVAAVEQSKQSWWNQWSQGGVFLVVFAFVYSIVVAFLNSEVGELPEIFNLLVPAFYLLGMLLFVVGLALRKRVLRVRTPGESYEFQSRGSMSRIAHSIHQARAKRESWKKI